MSLVCGGRGPCCHVGYSHRHCEHCDVVVATTYAPWPHYWINGYGQGWGLHGIYGGGWQGAQGTAQSQIGNSLQQLSAGLHRQSGEGPSQ
jgi:hypothetical protein